MVGQPVLIRAGGTLEEQFIANEVTDTTVLLAWTNACLFHRLGEGTQHWRLNDRQFQWPQSGAFPAADRREDSRTLRLTWRRRLIAQTNLVGRKPLEVDSNLAVRQEDQRFDERALAGFAEGPLA